MIVAKNWREYYYMVKYGIFENRTHAHMNPALTKWEKSLGRWWRGVRVKGNFPYGGYLSDKKWYLNEEVVISHIFK